MKPRVSRLRHSITFLSLFEVSDGAGGVRRDWTASGDPTKGDFRPISPRRVLDAESTSIMHRATVIVRRAAVPAPFDALKCRLRVGDLDHTILSAVDVDGDGRFITLTVERIV